ncbi:hypothetical protein J6590_048655 [Homalodisca vitripennis]|nr:hypothetical protein J6590_048655 [Homalodisca vitripennis]
MLEENLAQTTFTRSDLIKVDFGRFGGREETETPAGPEHRDERDQQEDSRERPDASQALASSRRHDTRTLHCHHARALGPDCLNTDTLPLSRSHPNHLRPSPFPPPSVFYYLIKYPLCVRRCSAEFGYFLQGDACSSAKRLALLLLLSFAQAGQLRGSAAESTRPRPSDSVFMFPHT